MGQKARGSSVRLTSGSTIKLTRGLLFGPGRITSWINYEQPLPRHSTQIGGFGRSFFSMGGGNRNCLAGIYGPVFESSATPETSSPGHCLDAAAGAPNSPCTRQTPCAQFNDLDGNRPGAAAILQSGQRTHRRDRPPSGRGWYALYRGSRRRRLENDGRRHKLYSAD